MRMSMKIPAVLIVIAMAALPAACTEQPPAKGTGGSGTTSEATGGQGGDEGKAGESGTESKTLNLKIGESAKYSGVEVTVLSAGPGPKDLGGGETFKFKVKYVNTGEDRVPYNPLDWQVEDSNGARSQEPAMVESNQLSSGDLAPGGTVTGEVFYTVKDGVGKVVYSPTMFSGEEELATWNVK